jgi:hypothetical protein
MTSCCRCPQPGPIDSDRGVFHVHYVGPVKPGDIPPVSSPQAGRCHCHRGWGAHPPTLPLSCPRMRCALRRGLVDLLFCHIQTLHWQHRVWLWGGSSGCSLLSLPHWDVLGVPYPKRDRPATAATQTCLLLFGSCLMVHVTSWDVRVSLNTFRAAKQTCCCLDR